jgi:hypothetical protein
MINTHLNMEYNSEREPLVISEYGRTIQELVEFAKKIENPEEKQAYFNEIIEIITRMNTEGKKTTEYKEKVWRHLFKIANYELDGVIMPNGEIPQPKVSNFKPPRVDYPESETKFRHYGHLIHKMIDKALEMESGPMRMEFTIIIASFMKMAYKTWSPEHYMNENMIRLDLETLSKGQLKLPDDISIDALYNNHALKKKKQSYLYQEVPKAKKKRKK